VILLHFSPMNPEKKKRNRVPIPPGREEKTKGEPGKGGEKEKKRESSWSNLFQNKKKKGPGLVPFLAGIPSWKAERVWKESKEKGGGEIGGYSLSYLSRERKK